METRIYTYIDTYTNAYIHTGKPILYVCNVSEGDVVNGNKHTEALQKHIANRGGSDIVLPGAYMRMMHASFSPLLPLCMHIYIFVCVYICIYIYIYIRIRISRIEEVLTLFFEVSAYL